LGTGILQTRMGIFTDRRKISEKNSVTLQIITVDSETERQLEMIEWKDVEKLAFSICWRYSKRTGVDFNDLVSVCKCAFYERRETIDEERGKSRYLYRVFTGTVLDEIKSSKKFSERPSHESFTTPAPFPLFDFLTDAPGDVREIVTRILTPEVLGTKPLKLTPTSLRSAIKRELKQKGWTYVRQEKAFSQLGQMLFG